MSDKKNIYQRIAEVMKQVSYVKKDADITGGGVSYKAVTHDQVVADTRQHFIDAGVLVVPEQLQSTILTARDVNAKIPVKMMLYSGDYAVHFVNIDEPKDEIIVTINAHANDNGDKSPGKAITYATKTAILKILLLETGINDESRGYEPQLYRPEEKEELDRIIADKDSMAAVVMSRKLSPEVMIALYNSFEKGQITKSKKAWTEVEQAGWVIFNTIAQTVKSRGAEDGAQEHDDTAVKEAVDELSDDEKKVLAGLLDKDDIDYLKELSGKEFKSPRP